ncbi:zinc finger, CCHC-type containing protein [Tanacetum coccineum]
MLYSVAYRILGVLQNTTRLRLFCFSLRDQAINWLDRLPAGSISTWDDLTTRFLAQFFPPRKTAKLRNDILMFQQHQDESLYDAWTRFKDLLRKVPHHSLDLWLQVQIFYDHVDYTTQMAIDHAASERLRKLRPEEAWKAIEDLAKYEEEEQWNEPIFSEKGSPDYIDANLEQELESMERQVESLMRSESVEGRRTRFARGRLFQSAIVMMFKIFMMVYEHRLYLTRRSLEVLKKFHWMILVGLSNQLSHVSSPLLRKPEEC